MEYQELLDKGPPECSECKIQMERNYSLEHQPHPLGRHKDLFEGDGLFLEHADTNGRTFKSRSELRRWCRENGVTSSALL